MCVREHHSIASQGVEVRCHGLRQSVGAQRGSHAVVEADYETTSVDKLVFGVVGRIAADTHSSLTMKSTFLAPAGAGAGAGVGDGVRVAPHSRMEAGSSTMYLASGFR